MHGAAEVGMLMPMTGNHGLIAIVLAAAGVVVSVLGSAEWAAPLFSVALVEGAFAGYARWRKHAQLESSYRAQP